MSVKIAKPTEPVPSFADKAKLFFREHGWLCIGGFVALLFATAEGRRPESDELQRYRSEIAALSPEEQKELQLRAVAFRQMDATQQAAVLAVHQQVQAQPELVQTLADYQRWLDRLPKERRDAISAEADMQKKLTAIREMRDANSALHQRPDDDPNGPRTGGAFNGPFAGPGGIGQMGQRQDVVSRLSSSPIARVIYDTLMQELAKEVGLPEKPEKADARMLWDHHIRVVEKAMLELPQDGKRSVRDVVQRVIGNRVPRDEADRVGKDSSLPFEIMSRQLVQEGVVLFQKDPASREAIMNGMPPKARNHFEEMPSSQRDKHVAVAHIREMSPRLGERVFEMVVGSWRRGDRNGPGGEEDFGPPRDEPPRDGPGGRGPRPNDRRPQDGPRPGQGGFGGPGFGPGRGFEGRGPEGRPADIGPPPN